MRPDRPSRPVKLRMVASNLKLPDFVNLRFSRPLTRSELRRLRDVIHTFFDVRA